MKFSMIFEAQMENPTVEHERQVILDCIDQAVYAEEMGFDEVWAVEHHGLVEYAHMSAPEIFLTAVAMRTSRIRIGHGAVCLPFHYNNPVRVAERLAMLDIISGGRVNFGAARGGTDQELALCGVKREDTAPELEEALRLIGQVWREETFEWETERLSIHPPEGRPPHTLIPRPVQWPHPPMYLACSNFETVKNAARMGVAPMILGFGGPDAMAGARKMFDEACATRDESEFVSPGVVNNEFVALCPTCTMEDGEEALRVGARALRFFAEAITHWSAPNAAPPARDTADFDNVTFMREEWAKAQKAIAFGETPPTPASRNYNLDHAIGTPQVAIDYVKRLRAIGVTNVMCLIQMGTLTQEQCLESIRLWGEQVIPYFRKEDEAEAAGAIATA
jgi:alkanesulfonate monooxygenase SsuD/methylene tetrahydromethanopterin reductase-like flavin-dependent oxidoreductase (luciferase family)